jgi:hypothetical protein
MRGWRGCSLLTVHSPLEFKLACPGIRADGSGFADTGRRGGLSSRRQGKRAAFRGGFFFWLVAPIFAMSHDGTFCALFVFKYLENRGKDIFTKLAANLTIFPQSARE